MVLDKYIKVKNYKCFGDRAQGFDKIYPINVLVGKNNSGKSSLIELIKYCTGANPNFIRSKRNYKGTKVLFPHTITLDDPNIHFAGNQGRHAIDGLTFDIEKGESEVSTFNTSIDINAHQQRVLNDIGQRTALPLAGKIFKCITAERDIVLEGSTNETKLSDNGAGATGLVQVLYTNTNYDTRLINRTLFRELNAILQPDIHFTDINVRVNSNTGLWEIYFEDGENGYIPLSKMGSGIKTVLLVLLNLLILPTIEGNTEDQYVFAFEELENNLHPALLRRLFLYIIKYCEQYNSYFFITTHSNIVIDIFGNYENSQIIHVTKDDDGTAICSTVKTHFQNKNILCDLDIRASDLLQSNGIIWVEGPSDRIYINKWLQSITSFYKEGVHYSFVFYGGKSIANMSFDSEWVERELIPLLKINHNAFVIMDRDGKDNAVELNSTKRRIIAEIGEENCWVTEGREIENYLSNRTLSEWLKEKHGIETKVQNDKDTKLENTISPLAPLVKYETAKKQFSIEISEFISLEDVATLDLASNMTKLMKRINDWNSLNTKA